MSERPGRAKGLFIQAFGRRNLNPCQCCEHRYTQSYREIDGGTIHVMWPFFECVSLEGFANGVCGNCAYHLESPKCSYAASTEQLHPKVQAMRARRQASFEELGLRRLNLENSPIIEDISFSTEAIDALRAEQTKSVADATKKGKKK